MTNPSPSLLREIGEALDGPDWRTAHARRRGVDERTVRRWDKGQSPVPDLRAEWISDIDAKIAELRALRRKLRS